MTVPPLPTELSPAEAAKIRLIVSDMDGTLLDDHGSLPLKWDETVHAMNAEGITFSVASGRQYETLATLFAHIPDTVLIAENGTHVVHGGRLISSAPLPSRTVRALIDAERDLRGTSHDAGVVLCGIQSAHVERGDERFLTVVRRYFHELAVVADFAQVSDEIVKVSIYDFRAPESELGALLAPAAAGHTITAGATHWLDVQRADVNKGTALQALQRSLSVAPEETLVFGDYLNDLPLFSVARWRVAMRNAHPDVIAAATHITPSNKENGVQRFVNTLLRVRALAKSEP